MHLSLYRTYSKGYFVNNSVHTSLIEIKHGRVKKKSISKSSKIEQNEDSFAVLHQQLTMKLIQWCLSILSMHAILGIWVHALVR